MQMFGMVYFVLSHRKAIVTFGSVKVGQEESFGKLPKGNELLIGFLKSEKTL